MNDNYMPLIVNEFLRKSSQYLVHYMSCVSEFRLWPYCLALRTYSLGLEGLDLCVGFGPGYITARDKVIGW